MNRIYEWLLQNTGNEANVYTILNCHRSGTSGRDEHIRVMGRLKNFTVVNLLIARDEFTVSELGESLSVPDGSDRQHLRLASEQAVIHYLSTGEADESTPPENGQGIQVWVDEPRGEAGAITFSTE